MNIPVLIFFALIFLVMMTSLNKLILIPLFIVGILYLLIMYKPYILMYKGNKKYMEGNIDDALKLYEKASELKLSKPHVKISLAYLLLREGSIEKSEHILKEIMKEKLSKKDEIDAILNLSLVLWKKEDLDGAIKLLKDLYDSNYKSTILYQSLGYYLILKGNYAEALSFNLEAYDYNNSDSSILDNLALNYYFIEDYDNASKLYKEILAMNPSFVSPYYFYGQLLIKNMNYEEALKMLKAALDCRYSFLSAVSKEDVEKEIEKVESLMSDNKLKEV